MAAFTTFIQELQASLPVEPDFEPEIDDKDEKKDKELREQLDLTHGAVRSAIIDHGAGAVLPQEGDLVILHVTTSTPDKRVWASTRREERGTGQPLAFVLGKGKRALRGWELALSGLLWQACSSSDYMHKPQPKSAGAPDQVDLPFRDMQIGTRCLLDVWPQYAYAHRECQLRPPQGLDKSTQLHFDLQLLAVYPKLAVRVLGAQQDIYKWSSVQSDSWETPRAPFEVEVEVHLRTPAESGQLGEGPAYWSAPADRPLKFVLGTDAAPPGLEEAVTNAVRGERSITSCPAQYLAESSEVPGPPAGAERVEIELALLSMLQIRDMTGTGEVIKRRLREGAGEFPMDSPLEDCAVRVHVRGLVAGSTAPFINTRGDDGAGSPLAFDTGMGEVPESVDMAVRLMTPGELAQIHSSAKYAYEGRPDRPDQVPEGAKIEWELELVSFDKQPFWQNEPPDAKIKHAGGLKEQGNRALKAGNLRHAKDKYQKSIRLLDRAMDIETSEQATAADAVKLACLLNLAACCQRQQEYGEALSWCEKALREQPDSSKAYWRRASAHAGLGNFEEAFADLQICKDTDPSTAGDVDTELARLRAQQRAAAAKQKQQFRNFFDRTKA